MREAEAVGSEGERCVCVRETVEEGAEIVCSTNKECRHLPAVLVVVAVVRVRSAAGQGSGHGVRLVVAGVRRQSAREGRARELRVNARCRLRHVVPVRGDGRGRHDGASEEEKLHRECTGCASELLKVTTQTNG